MDSRGSSTPNGGIVPAQQMKIETASDINGSQGEGMSDRNGEYETAEGSSAQDGNHGLPVNDGVPNSVHRGMDNQGMYDGVQYSLGSDPAGGATMGQTVPQDIGEPMQGLSGHNIGANMQDFHSTNGYAGADNMNDVWSFVEGDRITPMQDIIDVVRPLKRGRFYNGKRPNPFQ